LVKEAYFKIAHSLGGLQVVRGPNRTFLLHILLFM